MNNYHKRLLNIKSGRNFRELGGYQTLTGKKIKYHKLLRTGNLADLLPEDTDLLENYNVKLIIDFRSEKEKINTLILFLTKQNMNLILFLARI
ncbi:hypothetical protein HMPREF9211_1166 [Lactobacillus iners LactinV 01V1-a]|uniref:Uncharacterized protein n=1 Tax=Lactobacillus iners LactinV 01V1-a TaxID=879297 RepID=E1NTV8_9LACO|nr:hypothetical protein HMPREF9211_1166 [Lactobacillus iners LactinV 01V1-a]